MIVLRDLHLRASLFVGDDDLIAGEAGGGV